MLIAPTRWLPEDLGEGMPPAVWQTFYIKVIHAERDDDQHSGQRANREHKREAAKPERRYAECAGASAETSNG